ncbi:bifunctional DNA primase/polymerase [Algisphaera agarilytica]|uniref:DNA primase/polymerase bifunctional N-terminal domain-containing protein n=1 Tax=Algisphaera agarilytica TaxID=1385975 RepID=A0A7X0LJQ5_9BACT|nr:bifunctional DNA primase/polymerase [Algisphaera agarilytica]MBB6428851.1 hypothetical protein [Algisphaera agarilytica]
MNDLNKLLRKEALAAVGRGWKVFPLAPRSKMPLRNSAGWKDASTCPEQVQLWWSKTPEANIGLATGEVSGVVVLDVDPQHGGNESLTALEAEHGPLPTTVETATGGGGRHLYFNHPGRRISTSISKIGDGLDVLGDRGSVVLPESIHKTGTVYEWTHSPNTTPIADLPGWLGKLMDGPPSGSYSSPVYTPPVNLSSLSSSVLSVTPELESLIVSTQPTAEGQRHRRLFDLARGLKALPEYAQAEARAVRQIVKQWHALAQPIIGTKEWEATWGDFVESWPKVKHPAGTGPFAEAVSRAKQAPNPPEAEEFDSPSTKLLLRICRELQRQAGDEPFYLACRTAAQAISINHNSASRLLKMFTADGLLELVAKNTTHRATRYRYLGSMD